jgi:hypothetical protein
MIFDNTALFARNLPDEENKKEPVAFCAMACLRTPSGSVHSTASACQGIQQFDNGQFKTDRF